MAWSRKFVYIMEWSSLQRKGWEVSNHPWWKFVSCVQHWHQLLFRVSSGAICGQTRLVYIKITKAVQNLPSMGKTCYYMLEEDVMLKCCFHKMEKKFQEVSTLVWCNWGETLGKWWWSSSDDDDSHDDAVNLDPSELLWQWKYSGKCWIHVKQSLNTSTKITCW